MLLQTQDVQVFYGATHALRGTTVAADGGEIVAVLGANGAGKTTLLRTISGLVRATSGSIHFEGRDIRRMNPVANVRAGIVLCPEGRDLFESLTVEENLRLGALRTRISWRKLQGDVEQVMDLFPFIRERLRQRAGTLSGGEQQMVALARSILARPRLLLLDEPALGLAPRIVERLFALLPRIAATGVAILLVEQNATAALSVANRAYVLKQGQVISAGPACNTALHIAALEHSLPGAAASADPKPHGNLSM